MLIYDFRAIGNRLLAIRRRQGLTQAEVAEAAGLADRTYADIERGTVNMRLETILRICQALHITPDEILTQERSAIAVRQEELIARLFPDCVLNLETALYAYGYLNRKPYGYKLSVDKNTSKSRFKLDFPPVVPLYAEPETLTLGVTEIGYGGAKMKIFDRERLMCECLKYEDKMERELFKEGLLAYIRDPKKDVAKLMKYARERRVVKKVQTMIGVWL